MWGVVVTIVLCTIWLTFWELLASATINQSIKTRQPSSGDLSRDRKVATMKMLSQLKGNVERMRAMVQTYICDDCGTKFSLLLRRSKIEVRCVHCSGRARWVGEGSKETNEMLREAEAFDA